MLYLIGLLTIPALYVLGVYARDAAHLWRAVRRYGGEDERVLTRGGRVMQWVLQVVARMLRVTSSSRRP
jgi:hypothetical protein